MKKTLFIIFLVSIVLCAELSFGKEDFSFQVVVNSTNPDTVLTKEELSKIFLKKVKKWDGLKEKIMPVDLVEDSSIRKEFSEKILDKQISSVKAYWQKQIFSGRGVPPPEKKSDEDILEYIEENQGAIGYISKKTKIGKYDVKLVEITED